MRFREMMSSWLQSLTDWWNFLNSWKWDHISFIDWTFSWIGSSHSASCVLSESEFMDESAISLLSSLFRASPLNVQIKEQLRSFFSLKGIYVTKILYTYKEFFRIFGLIEILQIVTSTFAEPEIEIRIPDQKCCGKSGVDNPHLSILGHLKESRCCYHECCYELSWFPWIDLH